MNFNHHFGACVAELSENGVWTILCLLSFKYQIHFLVNCTKIQTELFTGYSLSGGVDFVSKKQF